MDKDKLRQKIEQLIDYIRDVRMDQAARRDGGDRLMALIAQETKKAEVKGEIKALEDAYKLKNPIARSNYVKAKLTQLQESEGEG